MNSNKKLTEARGIPQALKRQTARQFKPVVAQLKTGISAQSIKRPIAPAVYRPQPVPKVLQTKSSLPASAHAGQAPLSIGPLSSGTTSKRTLQRRTNASATQSVASQVANTVKQKVGTANAYRAVQLSARNPYKHLEGAAGQALRMQVREVTVTGSVTASDGTKINATCRNRAGFKNRWPKPIFLQWKANNAAVSEKQAKGQEAPFPDNDAEACVVDRLIGQIEAAGLPTQGGSLSLVASGTEICTYCRRLIRTFCKYYGLTWADDPQHEAK